MNRLNQSAIENGHILDKGGGGQVLPVRRMIRCGNGYFSEIGVAARTALVAWLTGSVEQSLEASDEQRTGSLITTGIVRKA